MEFERNLMSIEKAEDKRSGGEGGGNEANVINIMT